MAVKKSGTTAEKKKTTSKKVPAKETRVKQPVKPKRETVKKTAAKQTEKPAVKKATIKKSKTTKTEKKPAGKKPYQKTRVDISQKNAEKDLQIYYAAIDYCGIDLTPKMRDFLVYYIIPGQPFFHNALKSAIKAGYAEATAKAEIYRFLALPEIQKILRTNEALVHQDMHEAAKRAREIKKQRAFYDPSDYFEKKKETRITKDGGSYEVEVMALKDFDSMTEEQRLCIDGLEVKGQGATPVYMLPNREKALDDIIKMDNELIKSMADTGAEETREIIIERITIRETKRAERPAELEYEIIDRPSERDEAEEDEDV